MRWQKVACVLVMAFAVALMGCGGKSGAPDAGKSEGAAPAKETVKKAEPEKPAAPAGEASKAEAFKKEAGEAVDAAKAAIKEDGEKALKNLEAQRADFQKKVDRQFAFLSSQLDTVKEELAKKGTAIEEAVKQNIAAAEDKKKIVTQRLEAFKQSSDQTYTELRRDLMRAFSDFRKSIEELSGKSPEQNPAAPAAPPAAPPAAGSEPAPPQSK